MRKQVSKYYDGTNLLKMKDEEGKEPNVFISLSGRSYGKTTWFYNYMLERAVDEDKRFVILTRNKNNINGVAENFISGYKMREYDGMFSISNLNDGVVKQINYRTDTEPSKILGYVFALSSSNKIKEVSKKLEENLDIVFFDEFIVESGSSYLTNEMTKLQSICQSVFRTRHYKIVMCANLVSSICPAFSTFVNKDGLCITDILEMNREAKRLKGIGWVLEIAEQSEYIKNHLQENNRAFAASNYTKMSVSNAFNDDRNLIDKSVKKEKRIAVAYILNDNDFYLLSVCQKSGIYFFERWYGEINDKIDKYTITQNNIGSDTIYINGNTILKGDLRRLYDAALIKFDSLSSKQLIVNFIKYDVE